MMHAVAINIQCPHKGSQPLGPLVWFDRVKDRLRSRPCPLSKTSSPCSAPGSCLLFGPSCFQSQMFV